MIFHALRATDRDGNNTTKHMQTLVTTQARFL